MKHQCDAAGHVLLVVDNANDPATRAVAEQFAREYVIEERTGLSHARNRALDEVQTEWILYFDDDGIAHPDLLANLSDAITCHPEAVAIGGWFDHILPDSTPDWVKHYYRTPLKPSPAGSFTKLAEGEYLFGGIMAFRVSALRAVGGFDPALGMSGRKVGYGEDDGIQDQLRKAGYDIHYEPKMGMDHHVQQHKQTIEDRINMARAHGYSSGYLMESRKSLFWLLRMYVRIACFTLPYDLARIVFRPNFKWQNAIVSVASKLAHAFGVYRGSNRDQRK
ncbi:hypothetical protein A3850_018205 [Lewinella sp. 4G2]|nr:hypothetical protein A3850_018205 [Lewinella sp. 4G2]